jgi:hypothetical protein
MTERRAPDLLWFVISAKLHASTREDVTGPMRGSESWLATGDDGRNTQLRFIPLSDIVQQRDKRGGRRCTRKHSERFIQCRACGAR